MTTYPTLFVCISASLIWSPSSSLNLQVEEKQVCQFEVFQARCPYGKKILITQARYGHIEASRCVAEKFEVMGYFGCFSNVRGIISAKCSGKQRCEVPIPDNNIEIPESCLPGLPLYLDVSYVCIPDTVIPPRCNSITISRQRQYISSDSIWEKDCRHELDQGSRYLEFEADANLKIKFTFNLVHFERNHTMPSHKVYIRYGSQNNTYVTMVKENHEVEVITKGHIGRLVVPEDWKDEIFLLGFQAIGCDDLQPPPHTWLDRKGDTYAAGCSNSDHVWTLTCHGTNWIGPPLGNCTPEVKVVQTLEPIANVEDKPTEEQTPKLSKEVIVAMIVGVTLLMCAIVITTGYVYLKRVKYANKAKEKNAIELNGMLLEGDGTSSWTRSKVPKKPNSAQDPSNSDLWQQSFTRGQVINANGTLPLPPNAQKYYILDRDDVNVLNA